MIKRAAAVFLLLVLPLSAGAVTLTNTSGFAPTTDSVYLALQKLDNELDVVYTHLMELYRLQAKATEPSAETTGDLWLDISGTPAVLKWYDGDSWEALVNPSGYDSTLTYENAAVGMKENCPLSWSTASTIKLAASAALPATMEVAGEVLQVTSDLTLDMAAYTVGTYYVHGIRTGSTTAFTLGTDTVVGAGVNYLGVVVLSDTGVIDSVRSYEAGKLQERNFPLATFWVGRQAAQSISAAYTKIEYDLERVDTENNVTSYRFTATRAGWYEVGAKQTINGTVGIQCLALTKNFTAPYVNEACTASSDLMAVGYVYMAVGDYVEVYGKSVNTLNTVSGDDYSNAFWGRWLGAIK